MSNESSNAIFDVLSKNFTDVRVSTVNNLADLEALVSRRPDLVFLGMEFIPSDASLGLSDPNKIWLASFLDNHMIAYTGSPGFAHKLGRDKTLAKQRIIEGGLKTSNYLVIEAGESVLDMNLNLDFPLFVKPANRGGGVGIDSASVVHDFNGLSLKVNSIINNLHSTVLIEEYLEGREFSVAILKQEYSDDFFVIPIELIAPPDENGNRLLSNIVKTSDMEQVLEVSDLAIRAKVSDLALAVFHALGARDYGRVDIRLDKDDVPHFLEVNLIPSLISGYGSFPKALMLSLGLDYEAMIMSIVELGLVRSFDAPKFKLTGFKKLTEHYVPEFFRT